MSIRIFGTGTVASVPEVIQVGDKHTDKGSFRIHDGFSYWTVVAWGQVAEQVRGLTEGEHVIVEGTLRGRSYEKDGQTIRVTEINASSIESLTPAEEEPSKPVHDDDLTF